MINLSEYSNDKANNKNFVDSLINNNNQINENINSISNNNNNNSLKLNKMDEEISILKENVIKMDNESKNKINMMENNSERNWGNYKKYITNEINQIKNLLNSEIDKNKIIFKDKQNNNVRVN